MARVTQEEVRVILTADENTALSDPAVDSAIIGANIMVNGLAEQPCFLADSDGGVARAKQVELHLSADIAVTTSGGGDLVSEKIGDAASKKSTGTAGRSNYYRTATMLDCSNTLIESDKRSLGMFSIGTMSADNLRQDNEI